MSINLDQRDQKFVDPTLYTRIPRPISRPHPLPNEIYLRSNHQSTAPLLKRIKELFFSGNVDSVHVHASGKQIQNAVKLCVNFTNSYTPWFTTMTYTSTEIVIDDFIPKVLNEGLVLKGDGIAEMIKFEGINNNQKNKDNSGESEVENNENVGSQTCQKGNTAKRKASHSIENDDLEDVAQSLTKKSKENTLLQAGQELVQLSDQDPSTKPLGAFSRERLISAIHIVITKVSQGEVHVL